jgi:hypothetical protein
MVEVDMAAGMRMAGRWRMGRLNDEAGRPEHEQELENEDANEHERLGFGGNGALARCFKIGATGRGGDAGSGVSPEKPVQHAGVRLNGAQP